MSQPAQSPNAVVIGRTAWIVSTVGHSEFCPAGNARLDLRSGRYAFTARAARRICKNAGLERPVSMGTVGTERLKTVRAAYLRVLTEGLEHPACRDGGRPEEIVVNNGGTPILVLSTGAVTGSAPDALSCWSEAASALHAALDDIFSSAHQR